MLSCKEVTLLTSKAMDGSLTWRERAATRLHLLYCRGCQRFRDQIRFLRRAARHGDASIPEDVRLPDSARSRIRSTLQKNR